MFEMSNLTENSYKTCRILICGDLNSRTGTEHDFVSCDNSDNGTLREDYVSDGSIAR